MLHHFEGQGRQVDDLPALEVAGGWRWKLSPASFAGCGRLVLDDMSELILGDTEKPSALVALLAALFFSPLGSWAGGLADEVARWRFGGVSAVERQSSLEIFDALFKPCEEISKLRNLLFGLLELVVKLMIESDPFSVT